MRTAGVFALIFGVLLGVVALNMDTSVATKAQTVAGVEIPSQRVNNLGLMDDRRNLLLVAGVMVIAGVIAVSAASFRNPGSPSSGPTRTCPHCAETIRRDAVVCRFCDRDIAPYVEEDSEPGLTRAIDELKAAVGAISNADAYELVELGSLYARRFDETGADPDRTHALACMTRAWDLNPEAARAAKADVAFQGFGSLARDAEFQRFQSEEDAFFGG
jgi:hypothetical protein